MRTSRGSGWFFLWLLVLALFTESNSAWPEQAGGAGEMVLFSKTEPVYFSADRITYDRDKGVVIGEGNAEIVQAESKLEGDRVVINIPRELAEIEGNVIASGRGAVVEGARGIYDFKTGEGVFYEARGHDEPWYISAEEIDRSPIGGYTVKNASLTTCSGPNPHYALKAGTVTVVPEERITARNLALFAGPIPIFYFPYYSQDLDTMIPPLGLEAGTQSDAGAYVGLAYEIEPMEGVSLTPHIKAFTESGVGGGVNGELDVFDGAGRGGFDTFYIYDLSQENTDEPGVDEHRGTAYLFYRQELPDEWNAILRAEYNSDSEFLKTFSFSRYEDLEPPKSYFNIERTGLHSVVSFLTRVRLADYVEETERLPQVNLDLLEQRLGDTGLFFSAGNEIAYLNREPQDYHSGRNFTHARASYPVRLWKRLEMVPFIEGDATYYSDTIEDDEESRLSWSSGITAETQLQRVFGSPFSRYSGFRHLVVPTVTYRFRPEPDERPEELLQFDEIDRIDRRNGLEIEIKNFVQAKDREGVRRDLLQYTLMAGLEFEDGRDKLAQLENELWIIPAPRWKLALEAFNDFRDETRSDLLSAALRYSRPDSFGASVGVVHGDSELTPVNTQLVYSASKDFGPLWRAGFEQRYDFSEEALTFHEFWIWRSLDCLEALLVLRDRRDATSVMLLINITAFPMRQIERQIEIEPIEENRPWPIY